ncbi:hypothetical protein D3C72_747030 [compost metagenome]
MVNAVFCTTVTSGNIDDVILKLTAGIISYIKTIYRTGCSRLYGTCINRIVIAFYRWSIAVQQILGTGICTQIVYNIICNQDWCSSSIAVVVVVDTV